MRDEANDEWREAKSFQLRTDTTKQGRGECEEDACVMRILLFGLSRVMVDSRSPQLWRASCIRRCLQQNVTERRTIHEHFIPPPTQLYPAAFWELHFIVSSSSDSDVTHTTYLEREEDEQQ